MRIFSVLSKDGKKWKVFADNHTEVREISVRLKKVSHADKVVKIQDETEFFKRSTQYGAATREAMDELSKGIAILELNHPCRWVIKKA
jgi:hypothetical protein